MNMILDEIKRIMEQSREQYLPQVKSGDLEENGAVYFMNGKDGTEFEWYVNGKLPPFMMFYDDEARLGAVKCLLYRDGAVQVFVYDNAGKNMCKEVGTRIECGEKELLDLAVLLRYQAEDGGKWNANIEGFCTDTLVSDEMRNNFLSHESRYDEIQKNIVLMPLGKVCQELDRDVYKYLTAPAGTEFIRISETEFEIDKKKKAIFLMKR